MRVAESEKDRPNVDMRRYKSQNVLRVRKVLSHAVKDLTFLFLNGDHIRSATSPEPVESDLCDLGPKGQKVTRTGL